MWGLVIILAFVGTSVAGIHRSQSARLQIWRKAIQDCGLRLEEISSPMAPRLKLQAQGGQLEVRIQAAGRIGSGLRITIVIPGPAGFSGVRIRREHYRSEGKREIEIGEDGFDSTFFVEGPMRLLCGLLDAEMRELLVRANGLGEFEIFRSELEMESSDDQLSMLLPILLNLGWRFTRSVDVAQCLAENVAGDPAPGVRLRNLTLLVREHPGAPGTIETLRAACTDPSLSVRLRAALELRAEGRPILRELAQSTEDDGVSAQAVAAVGGGLPFEDMKAILDRALRRRSLETARACLEVLGRQGKAPAIKVLARVLGLEKGELAVAAALALGATGSAAAELPLIRALQCEPEILRVTAANALARVGTLAAVLALKDAAGRFPRDRELPRAIRQAIAEIQARRLPGVSPGQLSLAGSETGQLSLAEAEEGRLSLATDPAEEPGG